MVAGGAGVNWKYGTLLRDADSAAAFCKEHRDELAKLDSTFDAKAGVIPAPPILTQRTGFDDERRRKARQELGFADDHIVVGYLGYVYPEKGIDTLIEAVAIARHQVPNIRLVVIGGMPLNLMEKDPGYQQRLKDFGRGSASAIGSSGQGIVKTRWHRPI